MRDHAFRIFVSNLLVHICHKEKLDIVAIITNDNKPLLNVLSTFINISIRYSLTSS